MFKDRQDAGKQLAEKLAPYRGKGAVVLALPRGGVVTGFEIANALKLPLDIICVRKIGHPLSPEYAIGAVDENGASILNEAETAAVDRVWLNEEIARQKKEARRRSAVYREERRQQEIKGKTVILVDDGIATGLTMQLAARSVRAQKPEKIVVAVPAASSESVNVLTKEGTDEIIVLEPPEEFAGAVGAHYAAFPQTQDEEVVALLRQSYDQEN